MRKILSTKFIIPSIIILVIGISMARSKIIYEQRIMPDFKYYNYDNNQIERAQFDGVRTHILFLRSVNQVSLRLIKDMTEGRYAGKEKILIISPNLDRLNHLKNKSDVYLVENPINNNLLKKFQIDIDANSWLLVYDQNNYVESKNALTGINMGSILNWYQGKPEFSRGDVKSVLLKMKDKIGLYDPGVYFFTQGLKISCQCLTVFEELEDKLFANGLRLNVRYIKEIDDHTIENLNRERNFHSNVRSARYDEDKIIEEWANETGRTDFNFILLKNDTGMYKMFPLLSALDYDKWHDAKAKVFEQFFNLKIKEKIQ